MRSAIRNEGINGPRKHVDKSGSNDKTFCINHRLRVGILVIAEASDVVASDGDVNTLSFTTTTVINDAVLDIKHLTRLPADNHLTDSPLD